MTSPGVVLVSKYVSSKSGKFKKYVDYINRNEATRNSKFTTYNVNDFDGYNNYMSNPEKTYGLFTKNKDSLNEDEKKQLKKIFETAHKNESIMWQDVISFNNEWLEKHGLYNSETGWVNEGAIQNSIRNAMNVVLDEENMKESGVWSASIHLNTDNIHVHIALVEPYPTKEFGVFEDKKTGETYTARRGNRKKTTLDKFKSSVANSIVNRDRELTKISTLIHENMAPRELKFKPRMDTYMLRKFNDIYKQLPDDMRLWKYNNNAMNFIRPEIDSFISMYINKYHPEDFKEFEDMLTAEMNFRKEIYGDGEIESERYKDYKENKVHELYSKLGNAMLREMTEMRKEQRQMSNGFREKDWDSNNGDFREYQQQLKRSDLNRIRKVFDRDYQSIKNQQKYREMQREIEANR